MTEMITAKCACGCGSEVTRVKKPWGNGNIFVNNSHQRVYSNKWHGLKVKQYEEKRMKI